jgi:hypothetical protein
VIDELSIRPASMESEVEAALQPAASATVDLQQPLAQGTQVLMTVKTAASAIGTSTTAAAKAAMSSITALEAGLAQAKAAAAGNADAVGKLGGLATQAHESASTAAQEFEKLAGITSPEAEMARQSASVAQKASAAAGELSAAVSAAASSAGASLADAVRRTGGLRRVIEIRGRNLSADGTFMIKVGDDEHELPFRMLEEKNNRRMPEIVVKEENTGEPNMGRMLRLTIPRDELETPDRRVYDLWFSTSRELTFIITNPDGQKAGIAFTIPPASTQDK